MIKANELRIGNLVFWKDDKLFHEIRSVSKDRIHPIELIERDNNSIYAHSCQLEDLNPIPLTPEILEKAGFDSDNTLFFKKNGKRFHDYEFEFTKGVLHFGWHGDAGFVQETQKPIEYVHQLQNLYYALTGTELEINLNEDIKER